MPVIIYSKKVTILVFIHNCHISLPLLGVRTTLIETSKQRDESAVISLLRFLYLTIEIF